MLVPEPQLNPFHQHLICTRIATEVAIDLHGRGRTCQALGSFESVELCHLCALDTVKTSSWVPKHRISWLGAFTTTTPWVNRCIPLPATCYASKSDHLALCHPSATVGIHEP